MRPTHTKCSQIGASHRKVFKILSPREADQVAIPTGSCLAWDPDDTLDLADVSGKIWGGVLTLGDRIMPSDWSGLWISRIDRPEALSDGDVIRLNPGEKRLSVLYRRGANANTLFATERCNNLCLMCSQPPRDVDDSGLVTEMIQTVSLIEKTECQIGISGGEPTLLGQGLCDVLLACREFLPDTHTHVLTNGRCFADFGFAKAVCEVHPGKVTWAVPLYADNPQWHDYIVQAKGAFDETVKGLYHLALLKQPVELRIVLHKQSIPRLGELAHFIYRNLSFASHVAFMGMEPIGFAKANRSELWIDPLDYLHELADAVFHLLNRGMNVSIYNLPHCILPRTLWPYARQSISDWKNMYVDDCEGCSAKGECAGFFTSAGSEWRSRGIGPILELPSQTLALSGERSM